MGAASAASGGIILNDRTIVVYSMNEAEGSWLLNAAVMLRGSVPNWYSTGSTAPPPPPFSAPRGSGSSVGKYFVSIVRTHREVWIDTTMRIPLENFNVLLLDAPSDSVGMPVVHGRVRISPDMGSSALSGDSQSSRIIARRALTTELQRRLESCDGVANYLRD
jgi:hypothetical protein